jgi:hypothetical protein
MYQTRNPVMGKLVITPPLAAERIVELRTDQETGYNFIFADDGVTVEMRQTEFGVDPSEIQALIAQLEGHEVNGTLPYINREVNGPPLAGAYFVQDGELRISETFTLLWNPFDGTMYRMDTPEDVGDILSKG